MEKSDMGLEVKIVAHDALEVKMSFRLRCHACKSPHFIHEGKELKCEKCGQALPYRLEK